MSDITGIAPRSGLERDVVALASARWPTVAPMSDDDIARLLLLLRRSRALRRRGKHTKAARRLGAGDGARPARGGPPRAASRVDGAGKSTRENRLISR